MSRIVIGQEKGMEWGIDDIFFRKNFELWNFISTFAPDFQIINRVPICGAHKKERE